VANRRAERSALWQDSTNFHDSFFAPDNRLDGFGNSEFSTLRGSSGRRRADADDPRSSGFALPDDVAGVVIEESGEFVTRH